MKYCLDTSALIEPWVRTYPPDVFSPVWDKLAELAEAHVIAAPIDVRLELERQSDGLFAWVDALPEFFIEPDRAQIERVTAIVNAYPDLVKPNSPKSQADPFVIAAAELAGVPVVTYENMARKDCAPKIPNVCADRKIQVVTLLDVLRAEGLRL